jgi:homoserine O-succinyltransferase
MMCWSRSAAGPRCARIEVDATPALKTLIASDQAGPCLLEDAGHRALYVFNHFEYDSTTLKDEYDRDVAAGKSINVPENYYPDDDPPAAQQPLAQPCASALRQLDQRDLSDDRVRSDEDRDMRPPYRKAAASR